MFFLAEAIAVGRHFGLRCLPLPHLRTPAYCELPRNQSEGAVGFSVKRNPQKGRWQVDFVYPDTPASREPRLREKTGIYKVNGQSTMRMEYDQLMGMLQGPAGSNVEITVKKGFVFGSKTVVLKRSAPTFFDALACFGLQFVRRRVGGCALAATLTTRLGAGVNPTRRGVQRFDEVILRRVFGWRFMDALARNASDEMARMLWRPSCPFMVSIQVMCECFACNQLTSHDVLTVHLCRMMRGKESTNGERFVMLSPTSNTTLLTPNSLNSSYLLIQLLSILKKGKTKFSVHICTVVIVVLQTECSFALGIICLFTHVH
jgi:hypothetical protein